MSRISLSKSWCEAGQAGRATSFLKIESLHGWHCAVILALDFLCQEVQEAW